MAFRDLFKAGDRARAEQEEWERLRHKEELAEFRRLTPLVEKYLRIVGDARYSRTLGVLRTYRVSGAEPKRERYPDGQGGWGSTRDNGHWLMEDKDYEDRSFPRGPRVVVELRRECTRSPDGGADTMGEFRFHLGGDCPTQDTTAAGLERLLAGFAQ